MAATLWKFTAQWEKTNLHPLEYRAEINGATCVVRCPEGEWRSLIRRPGSSAFEVAHHPTHWHAKAHCEREA